MSFMGSVAGANLGTGYPGNLPVHPAYSDEARYITGVALPADAGGALK
jgi:hypothetical protein